MSSVYALYLLLSTTFQDGYYDYHFAGWKMRHRKVKKFVQDHMLASGRSEVPFTYFFF